VGPLIFPSEVHDSQLVEVPENGLSQEEVSALLPVMRCLILFPLEQYGDTPKRIVLE